MLLGSLKSNPTAAGRHRTLRLGVICGVESLVGAAAFRTAFLIGTSCPRKETEMEQLTWSRAEERGVSNARQRCHRPIEIVATSQMFLDGGRCVPYRMC